jgi:hypothetical protein
MASVSSFCPSPFAPSERTSAADSEVARRRLANRKSGRTRSMIMGSDTGRR